MQNDLPLETSQRLGELTTRIQASEQVGGMLSEIMGCLVGPLDVSLVASRLYVLWAKLSDFHDLRPDQRAAAVRLIRHAAREWSQVAGDQVGCDEYLTQWNAELDRAQKSAGDPPLLMALKSWQRTSRYIEVAFDPEADAVYVKLDESDGRGGETLVTESGVIVDTDAGEHIRGLEFLNVRTHGLPTDEFPAFIQRTLQLFEQSGALTSDVPVRMRYQ
jgi:uncharacterized protein YuzE